MFSENIFEIAKGTVCEPKTPNKSSIEPDTFLEYNGIRFGIGMDCKLYIHEDGKWKRA